MRSCYPRRREFEASTRSSELRTKSACGQYLSTMSFWRFCVLFESRPALRRMRARSLEHCASRPSGSWRIKILQVWGAAFGSKNIQEPFPESNSEFFPSCLFLELKSGSHLENPKLEIPRWAPQIVCRRVPRGLFLLLTTLSTGPLRKKVGA